MRGFLLASVSALASLLALDAHAADLPGVLPAKAEPAVPGTWTGFYLGTYVGTGLVETRWGPGTGAMAGDDAQAYVNTGSAAGAMVGAQAGYAHQVGAYVLGVEADLGSGFLSSQARCLRNGLSICVADTDALATLAARLGYAFGNVLLYGKAGAAFANTSYTASGTGYAGQFSGTQARTGWTAGGGVEVGLAPQVSGKIEYAYLDFGDADTDLKNGASRTSVPLSQSAQMVKLGLNWRPWGPPLPNTGPALPAPGRDWSGVYLGAHLGGAWGRDQWVSGTGFLAEAAADGSFPGAGTAMGLLGGGQVGFNVQAGAWVAGAEVSASAASLGSHAKCVTNTTVGAPASYACQSSVASLGSISGRLGQSWGDVLVYGKAGAAWVHGSSQMFPTLDAVHDTSSGTRWGWMLGSGVEYALARNVSAFIEYDYYDFGTQEQTYSGGGQSATADFRQRLDAVRMGLNYRFAGEGRDAPAAAGAPALPAGWAAEIGARYFASTGRMQKDLMDPLQTGHLNSRLIYQNSTGQSLETFFRFENQNGVFVKGFAGLGTLAGGALNDEDFPAVVTYSNTLSTMRDGNLAYGGIDLGYELIRQGRSTLGAFVGYRALYQSVNGFGCRQVAGDEVCDPSQIAGYPVLVDGLGLTETETWQGVALGLNARLQLSERMRLELDAAYLPYVTRSGFDNHWWRPDINPLVEEGHGWGTQLEAVLSYAVTDRLDVGIGARYWYFATDTAATQFSGYPLRSPMTFYAERYGAFLQASYRFGDSAPLAAAGADLATKARPAPVSWTGFYVGGTLGGGKGHSTYASPFPPPVSGDAVDLGGVMAGGQVGGDVQMGAFVLGAEASIGWADAVGSDTCFSTIDAGPTAGFGCGSRVNGLGTLTGRVGYALDRTLLYVRGGFAWDRQTDSFNTFAFNGRTLSHDGTNAGWTLGGGLDYALLPNLSVGLEYKHFDFGGSSPFTTGAPPALAGVNLGPDGLRLDTVALTLNYRFTGAGGPP